MANGGNRKHDEARSAKINAIRANARGISLEQLALASCPTCCRPAGDAYFRADARGHGVEGCVDAHHTLAHHVGERASWLYRPEAQMIRKAVLDSLLSL